MPTYGGMSPYPRRFGGGPSRVKGILDSLNADRGSAYDAGNRLTTVYVNNMAIARAIAAAWGTNVRLGNVWTADRMSPDVLARWEKILVLSPAPTDSDKTRRDRVGEVLSRFGQAALSAFLTTRLSTELGSAFVALETISLANAVIQVPDASYPWGSVGWSPWSSTVAHILVRLTKPTGWTEGEFYDAAGKVPSILDPLLPSWTTVDWYRPGAVSANISGGPSAGGFYLDEDHNLNEQVFDV